MKLTKGCKFLRDFFEEGSRPTKKELAALIDQGEIPGRVINDYPYVDVPRFIGQPRRTVQTPTTPDLLS